jgi:hypothetical protein
MPEVSVSVKGLGFVRDRIFRGGELGLFEYFIVDGVRLKCLYKSMKVLESDKDSILGI